MRLDKGNTAGFSVNKDLTYFPAFIKLMFNEGKLEIQQMTIF